MEQGSNLADDQLVYLKLAIQKLVPYCTDDAEHEELRQMCAALAAGDELWGESLEGNTNLSYRVYLKGNRCVSIFIKVAFDYARWNPDRSAHYALDRISTEFEMLKKFSDLLGPSAPVAKAYLCVDIGTKLRMMVAQWAPSHEAWAHQFVRGEVDDRVVDQVARFIARVNMEDYGEKDLNDGIKDSFRALYPISRAAFEKIISADGEPADHFVDFAKKMGQERFDQIIDAVSVHYERCDVLLHGDTHALNILVEPMTEEGKFGEMGQFFVCDWEMVHAGDKGRDPGTFFAWPILSAYFLAARGAREKAYTVIDFIAKFWNIYATELTEKGGKSEQYITELYRSSIGWCGVYAFIANYLLRVQQNYVPFDLVSKEGAANALASLALTGVMCLDYGFMNIDPTFNIDELKKWFRDLLIGQVEFLLEICKWP